MNNYYLKQLKNDQYYLVCLSYYSVLNYLEEIEKEPFIQSNQGTLIIDQLLVSGNGKNRFLTCSFKYGKIKLDTAKNIDAIDELKHISLEIFHQHLDILKYSILSNSQLESIRQGQAI